MCFPGDLGRPPRRPAAAADGGQASLLGGQAAGAVLPLPQQLEAAHPGRRGEGPGALRVPGGGAPAHHQTDIPDCY